MHVAASKSARLQASLYGYVIVGKSARPRLPEIVRPNIKSSVQKNYKNSTMLYGSPRFGFLDCDVIAHLQEILRIRVRWNCVGKFNVFAKASSYIERRGLADCFEKLLGWRKYILTK
jgi:hypothetical protein